MDSRLIDLYNRELAYLRTMGAEFAKEFPKIAGRLGGLDEYQACQDPFVERLLEGFAFLAARVQLKLDSEFPRFTQSLLEIVYPHYLAPIPSMCIVQFEPEWNDPALADGVRIEGGSALISELGRTEQTRCEYRTAHEVNLLPIRVVEANYHIRELQVLHVPQITGVKAGIQIRLQSAPGAGFDKLNMPSLTFHLVGPQERPMDLYEQLLADTLAVVIQTPSKAMKSARILDASCVRRVGFGSEERLFPYDARSFEGYRLLQEYFAFPGRFLFVRVDDLADAVAGCREDQLDIIFLLKNAKTELEGKIGADNFRLFCTPAINLFDKRLDRVPVSERFSEYHVVPDRTRPQDFEVYKLSQVVGYGSGTDRPQEFLPFYMARGAFEGQNAGYYVVNRVPRPESQRSRVYGPRSARYSGSEVYLSLTDASAAPLAGDVKELGVRALCTNRDLPLHVPVGVGGSDFSMDRSVPCAAIRCLGTPTVPRPSYAEGRTAWRLINHLSLNYLSLVDTNERDGASALRDILRLYSGMTDKESSRQIDGVRSVTSGPVERRIKTPQSIAFVRGLEVSVTLEEKAFEGLGAFLLGAVLEQFFAKYVSINSFTETVIRTVERGEIMRWAMREGLRATL